MPTTETVLPDPAVPPYVAPVAQRDALMPLDFAVDAVVGLALLGELIVVMANVIGRWLLDMPLLWADEVAGFSLSVIAFLGGAIAYRREQHVLVRTLVDLLPTRWRLASYALVDWLVLEIALIAGYQSLALLAFRWEEVTPARRAVCCGDPRQRARRAPYVGSSDRPCPRRQPGRSSPSSRARCRARSRTDVGSYGASSRG